MKRRSGILLHITSLPSDYGIGDLGPWAYRFADFLAEARQSFWQVLPLTPTSVAWGNSPYCSPSAFAGNKFLISPELMLQEGLLTKEDIGSPPAFPKNAVDYSKVIAYKERLFAKAFENFKKRGELGYEKFCSENSGWLEDYSLFVALKDSDERPWNEWPSEVRDRHPAAMQTLKKKFHDQMEKEKFLQYIFFKQWFSLKRYCNQKGIEIIGDLPMYVIHDSVEVWVNPEFFKLDAEKRPIVVSGVPPDAFSPTGQRWGHPIYRWDVLKERGYEWWVRRVEHSLRLYDWVRLDHFRGYVAYWEVPASEKTAVTGRWVNGPSEDLFSHLLKHFPDLPVFAEDLGTITQDVREVMQRFGFPGMRVLIFAFGEDSPKNPYLPHNHVKNSIVYTGTHDTNTVRGWFEREATWEDKKRVFRYLGREVSEQEIHLEFVRMAMMSVADMAIIPMQDILGLGEEARMNRPSLAEGNWMWRLLPEQLTPPLAKKLREMTEIYGRVNG